MPAASARANSVPRPAGALPHRLVAMAKDDSRPAAGSPKSLSGLLPFIRPYRVQVALAGLFLVLAALSTLAFPVALKLLIDQGLVATDPGERVMALRGHFLALFGVAAVGAFLLASNLGQRGCSFTRPAAHGVGVRYTNRL